jgi:DNA-binding NarL/FixJ family response regulator
MFFTSFVDRLLLEHYMFPDQSIVPEPSDERLSLRQQEVLQLLAEGRSTKEVAAALNLSTKTAETHRSSIMHKLHIHNVVQLIHYAVVHHMITVPILDRPFTRTAPLEISRPTLTQDIIAARVAA